MITEEQPQTATPTPMYASYGAFTAMLDWFGKLPDVPVQLDRSLEHFAGNVGGQMLTGLRFLGLLEGDHPTELLVELARAEEDKRKSVMMRILRNAYGEQLIEEISRMTPLVLEQRIEALGVTGSTNRKACGFLVNALRDADFKVPPAIGKRYRNRPSRRGIGRKPASGSRKSPPSDGGQTTEPIPPSAPKRNTRTLTFRNGETVSLVTDTDMLSLPAEDLEWLLSVVKMFDEYAEKDKESDSESETFE